MDKSIQVSCYYNDDDFINSSVSIIIEYNTNRIYIKGVPESFLELFGYNLVRGIISLKTKGINIVGHQIFTDEKDNVRYYLNWND